VSPTAATPSADNQQILVVSGLVNEAHLGNPDIHNHAHGNAHRWAAESFVNARGNEGFGLAVE